jgi:probable selenate reductase FAD-binding subunit
MFDHIRVFHQPRSIKDAVRLLHMTGSETCLVAGGTDLVLRAARSVTALVDISQLGLSYIKRDGRAVRIGATTTMAALEDSALIQRVANGILAQAASNCGGLQTRNMATIGGNLANASPAADTATPLLALDAEIVLRGLRGQKRVPLSEFFSGPHKSAAEGSLLIEVVIPAIKPRTAWSLQRLARSERDLAIVSVAAGIQVDRQNRCLSARIALGAVADQPMRALAGESILVGQTMTRDVIESAAQAATQEIHPISDVRASAEYRREMSRVLVRRVLQQCAERLECAL